MMEQRFAFPVLSPMPFMVATAVIVVGVYSYPCIGKPFDYLSGNLVNLVGKSSAVGVAQNEPVCPSLSGVFEDRQRVVRVCNVAVEKVLCVKYDLVRKSALRQI